MRKIVLLTLVLASACLTGCTNNEPAVHSASAPGAAQTQTQAVVPQQARGVPQPKLPTVKLWVGTNELTAEIASTLNQIQTGMMWRTNMAETEGMLFVFPRPEQVAFYMRNTLVPLSCAYMDPEGTILEIHDMKPLDETPIPSGSDQVQYVLEVNQGWFERHGVKPGMLVATDRGTFRETFIRR